MTEEYPLREEIVGFSELTSRSTTRWGVDSSNRSIWSVWRLSLGFKISHSSASPFWTLSSFESGIRVAASCALPAMG